MLDIMNQQILDSKTLLRRARTELERKKHYCLADLHEPINQYIADLEWQIKFTQMKLNLWRDLDNGQWTHLEQLQKQAKRELNHLKLKAA